jgi:hypothetical protein
MSETIIVGFLSLAGTLIGSICGIIASQKLTIYRIEQLEKKVDKHNQIADKVLEMQGRMNECEHNIRDLKGRVCA